jgi:hypothetical protein
MIDLAENAGAEFSLNKKIWDVTLSDATLHIGETERGAWEDKSTIYLVLMALFKNSPACNDKVCSTIHKNFEYWI